jgi:hypothetical protein
VSTDNQITALAEQIAPHFGYSVEYVVSQIMAIVRRDADIRAMESVLRRNFGRDVQCYILSGGDIIKRYEFWKNLIRGMPSVAILWHCAAIDRDKIPGASKRAVANVLSWTITPTSKEAAYLEAGRRYQIEDICRAFRIPFGERIST